MYILISHTLVFDGKFGRDVRVKTNLFMNQYSEVTANSRNSPANLLTDLF